MLRSRSVTFKSDHPVIREIQVWLQTFLPREKVLTVYPTNASHKCIYFFIKSPLNLQLLIFWFIQGFQLGHIQMVLVGTYSCTHSLIKSVRPMAYSFRSIIEFFQSTKSQLVTKSFLCLPWRALYIPSSGIMLFSCCPYEWSRGTIRWLKSPKCMQPMERQTSLIVV